MNTDLCWRPDPDIVTYFVQVGLSELLVLEVGPGYAQLVSPQLPQLSALTDKQLAPWQLLSQLSASGLHLLPEDRDAGVAGVVVKTSDAERAMCDDLAMIW